MLIWPIFCENRMNDKINMTEIRKIIMNLLKYIWLICISCKMFLIWFERLVNKEIDTTDIYEKIMNAEIDMTNNLWGMIK